MAEREAGAPHRPSTDVDADRDGHLAAVLAKLHDVRDQFDRISAAVIRPPVSLTLVGGTFPAMRAVLHRAGIQGGPEVAQLSRGQSGAVTLQWPLGELAGVPVRVRWVVDNPRDLAEQLERAEHPPGTHSPTNDSTARTPERNSR